MRHAIVEEENIPMDTVTNFDEVSISCKIQYCSIDWIGNVTWTKLVKLENCMLNSKIDGLCM